MNGRHSAQAAERGEPGYVWRSGQARRLAMIRRWVDLDGRLLDNGCGLGTYLDAFAPYSRRRFGLEVELDRARQARPRAEGIVQAVGEQLPFATGAFDFVLSNEVLEHVADDRAAAREMVRVLRPGGRLAIFAPNRWYPVEQHGIYWRGRYRFGNIPLVNYLPDPLRDRLAPHVRTYTRGAILQLFEALPVRLVHRRRIFGGYDNIVARAPRLGRLIRAALYAAEKSPFQVLGISHFLIFEKTSRQNM